MSSQLYSISVGAQRSVSVLLHLRGRGVSLYGFSDFVFCVILVLRADIRKQIVSLCATFLRWHKFAATSPLAPFKMDINALVHLHTSSGGRNGILDEVCKHLAMSSARVDSFSSHVVLFERSLQLLRRHYYALIGSTCRRADCVDVLCYYQHPGDLEQPSAVASGCKATVGSNAEDAMSAMDDAACRAFHYLLRMLFSQATLIGVVDDEMANRTIPRLTSTCMLFSVEQSSVT